MQCVATGSDGISAEAARGAYFVGFERDMDPAYDAQLAKCIVSLAHRLGAFGRKPGPTGSGPLSGQNLARLIERLIPGGEWDPRAASLLGAALTLAGQHSPRPPERPRSAKHSPQPVTRARLRCSVVACAW